MKIYSDECREEVNYSIKEVKENYNIKGIDIETVIKIAYCEKCKKEVYIRKLAIENDITVFDLYKEKVGLLTSKEIKIIRENTN